MSTVTISPDSNFAELEVMFKKMNVTMMIDRWGGQYRVTFVDLSTMVAVEVRGKDMYIAANLAFKTILN